MSWHPDQKTTEIEWESKPVLWPETQEALGEAYRAPALPATLLQMELLLQAHEIDLQAAADVVKGDPGFAATILGLANYDRSPQDCLWRVEDCIVHLGIEDMQDTVRHMPLRRFLNEQSSALLIHSRITAMAAEAIARHVAGVNAEQVYLAGLLHQLPELAQPRSGLCPRPWTSAARWRGGSSLPEFIRNAIRWMHDPTRLAKSAQPLLAVLAAACEWSGRVTDGTGIRGPKPRLVNIILDRRVGMLIDDREALLRDLQISLRNWNL